MQALEAIRRSIDTVTDLQSIVRTMKALAAASIRQYEHALESLTDYNRTVEMGLHVALRGKAKDTRASRAAGGRLAAVVFGSDHGLCGRFNEAIVDFAIAKMNGFQVRHEDRVVVAVGARVGARLEEAGQAVEEDFFVPGSAAAITATVQQLLLKIEEWRQRRDVANVLLCYNVRIPGIAHQPRMLHLLPIDLTRFRWLERERWPSHVLPTFSMDRERLFAALIRQFLFVSIFRACAESLASEHASRLLSMQAAEKNIEERLTELGARFRQQRQDSITEELLDVVAGFETLTRAARPR